MVFDVNPDAIGGRVSVQSHFGVVMRELEGVLQKISDRGHHDFPVDIEGGPLTRQRTPAFARGAAEIVTSAMKIGGDQRRAMAAHRWPQVSERAIMDCAAMTD